MKKIFNTFIVLLIINLSGYAQDITYMGKIVDARTDLPLVGVRIYSADMLETQSNSDGEFQVSAKANTSLVFKKRGYAWCILKVTNDAPQQIKFRRSDPALSQTSHSYKGEKVDEDIIEYYCDGQLIPKTEVADALSMIKYYPPKEIINDINFQIRKGDGTHRFDIWIL